MWQSWRQKKNYNTLLSWLRTICVLLLATIMRANVYKLLCIIMFNKFISNNWTSLCSASSTRPSTWHCPCLMPSAVLRRRCCCAPAPAIDRYPARRALSSKPVARRSCCRTMGQTTNGRTDRQTDARPFHRPCSACGLSITNNRRKKRNEHNVASLTIYYYYYYAARHVSVISLKDDESWIYV